MSAPNGSCGDRTWCRSPRVAMLASWGMMILLCGCGGGTDDSRAKAVPDIDMEPAVELGAPGQVESSIDDSAMAELSDSDAPTFRQPLQLGGPSLTAPTTTTSKSADQQQDSVVEAMQGLQILLGQWRGTTRNSKGDGFKALDEPEWVWDFQSDAAQPALVMVSESSPYLRTARLSYDLDRQLYVMTATDADSQSREYEGTFSEPVRNETGDNDKPQRTFKLELTEVSSNDQDEQWQLIFNQQENNRYLLELYRKRGDGDFNRFDTVSTQRQGTSFAFNDSDFGDKTCVISQGLGTTQVSYQGRNFWVCCSGCKAAFDDDPEKWIAKFEARKKDAAQ